MKVKVLFVSKKNMKGDESMKIKSLLGGVCVVAISLVLPCRADYTCVTNGFAFNYTVNTDGKAIIQYNNGALFKGEELVIPAQLDGRPVISLGHDAFIIVTNSFYETKRGRAFVENGPQEIGCGAFYTDGSGWDVVCVPGSVTRFSGEWCFRTVGKVYWTISSETLNIDQFAFSIAPYELRIVATCGVPNELHDKCYLWDCFGYYSSGRSGQTYYKCKKEHFEAWVARGGLDRFRGYVDDDYVYGEQSLVSFSVEGGEPVPDRTYRQGSPYQSFPTPTKIGYSFLSWRTIPYPEAGQNDGFVVDVDDVVTSPRETLYAEWSPLKPTWTVENTSATYDGNAHGITVRPIAPVDGVAVTYAETEAGPYTEVSPTLTESGTKQIWYVLKAPDWTPLTNSATLKVVKFVSDATVTKTSTSVSYVYSGTAKRPSVVLKDTTALPNLAVTAYSAGDVDGDGQLTENDITLIQRYNAYQKLSVEDKEKFPSYNLTGSALVAADVNKDGVVDANDVTALRAKFSGYELVEGTDYTVAYSDNVNAGTGRVTIIGKGNYGGSTVLEFTISKATLGESGEPGSGSQPSDGKSKYDVTCVYDGQGHTVNTNALSSLKINAATMDVAYSLDGAAGWGLEPPVYTNAGQYVIWYRLRNPNYNDYVHEVQLTITPKPISDSSITKTLTPDAFVYDGMGKMPKETIVDESVFRWQFVAPYAHGDVDGDGVLTQEDVNAIDRYLSYLEMDDDLKSFFEEYALTGVALVAADYNGDGVVDEADMTELEASFVTLQKGVDYTITYKNNVNPGTATAIVSGLGNYGGTTTLTFTIVSLEIAIDDGTGGAGGKDSRFSYSGMYDGQGHGISVKVTSVAEPRIRYALAQEGPYSDNLLLTNACSETAMWYTVSADGYNTYTNWATVTISPRTVTLTSGSASKVYDGTPLTVGTVTVGGDGFVDGEGATFDVTGAQTTVGTSANTFAYLLNDGTKAGNYEIATAYGTLEVTKATVGGGGDEPGGGELPAGGASKFDAAALYDGEGHTIDTNALTAAFGAAMAGAGETRFFYGSAAAGAAATGQGQGVGLGAAEVAATEQGQGAGLGADAGAEAVADWREVAPAFTNAGEHVVWYRVVNPNYEDFVHRAKVTIMPRGVTLTSGSASKVYDGTPLTEGTVAVGGDGFADGEGATFDVTGARTDVGTSENAFAYSLNDGTKAGNYEIATAYGTLVVTKATVGLGGEDEPGGGELPAGGASKFDAAALYDGAGHTIDTNALVAAFGAAMAGAGETRVFYGSAAAGAAATGQGMGVGTGIDTEQGEGVGLGAGMGAEAVVDWKEIAPTFTNAGEYVIWYRVTNPNYEDFVHRAKVSIMPRSVTLTSGSARKVYDGAPLTVGTVTVGGDGFVDGEGATFDVTGAQTTVGTSENAFAYSLNDGTKAGNYEISTAYGTLEVTKATVGPGGGDEPGSGELPAGGASKFDAAALYDGEGHTIDTNALVAAFGAAMAGAGETRFFYGSAAAGAAATGQGQGVGTGAAEEIGATGQGRDIGTGAEEVADWQEVAPAFTNAGEYAVWYKVVNPNYEDFVHRAKVTITPRAVTVKSRSRTKPYDGTPLRLTASDIDVSLTDGGTEPALSAGEAFAYGDFAERTAAGEVEATFTVSAGAGTQLANYALTVSYGTLTVTKATYPGQEPGGAGIAWSVAAAAATWVYDGRPHGVALTGVPAGVTAHLSGNTATDAGDYVATATLDYDAANYEPPAAPAPLRWSIAPRPLTLMAASKEKPYDGFPLAVRPGDITASGGGYADGECLDYFDFASITDVGEIPATFGYRDSATAKASNYAVTVVGGQTLKVTVGGDQVSVTADSGTWAYDGAEHRAATWRVLNGDRLVAGHELQVEIDPASVVLTPKDGPDGDGVVSNRFASVRIVETATGADRTRNYNLVLREGVLQVTNACIRAEWLSGTADVAKTYDGAATQTAVAAALLQPATVRYAVGETPPADGWTAEPPSFVHAGTQTVWYAVAADYYEPYTNGLRVAIAPRPVTLATPTKAKTYDGTPLTFGADEVAVGGDGYAPGESFALSDFASLADAGRIAARCAYAAGAGTRLADYAVTEAWGTLTVLASADEITVTAADGSWPYDGTVHALPAYTAENADTLRPGDELVVAFDPASVVLTPEDGPNGDGVVSNVITSVRVVRNGTTDVTRNYSLAWYPGTLRVTKARITFDREGSVDPSAFSTSATYDGAGHTAAVVPPALLTGPVTVKYGASSDAALQATPPAFTNAGVHTVFYTLDAPYYETYAGTATVTIAPRPVTLVSAGAEKVYDGTPLRADAVRVKEGSLGFVGDEGFTAACRGALTDVGAMENLFDYALAGGALAGNYAIAKEYGWLRVAPAALDPGAVFGGGETDAEGRLVCTRVYSGAPQPFALAPDFGEPYRVFYALVAGDESAYSETAPTRTHVAEGDLAVFFKFMSPNYAPYYGTGVLRIAPKTLTDEMVVADEDAAWFFDGTEKKPSVTVVDGNPNIATADDWTVAYSDRTGAGLFPVTVTGRNDYCGTVTKEFAILKRPVAPPAIPSKAYSGRLQRPSVIADSRWTVVANPGGTDAGDYTNVVLRLTAPADYRWKGLGEDETDWTGVFTIRRGANGWSVYPLIRSWTNGVDVASEPLGRPRFGTLSVAYRRRGASVAEETPLRPSAPGRYTARFWAEETTNYAGVALATPYEVDFEIFPGPGDPPAGDATATTPVPVPHAWLDAYVARFGAGDYEAAANAVGANGVALWESYVAGLDPADAASRFTAAITVGADGVPRVTWTPDLSGAEPPRVYTVYGKAGLGDADWTPVTDANRARMRFFRVQVELK